MASYVLQVSAETDGHYEDWFKDRNLEKVLTVMGDKINEDKSNGIHHSGYRISTILVDTEGH